MPARTLTTTRARHPFLTAAAGVFLATLCGFIAVGAVLPVLPRYIHGPVGGGDLAVGIVIGSFAVAAIVTRPFAGRLAHAPGPRPIMGAGSLLMAAGGAPAFRAPRVPLPLR